MCVADDCCGKCFRSLARALLIIVNVIFALAGLLMLGLGIALVVAPEKVLSFLKFDTSSNAFISLVTGGSMDSLIKAVGIFMIILGGVVVIIAFFGFFGASCDNKCMLVTYAVILIIIVLAEAALIIFAAVYPGKFSNAASTSIAASFNQFHQDFTVDASGNINYNSTSDNDAGWGAVQLYLGCCGLLNYTDYQSITPAWNRCGTAQCAAAIVPISCCKVNNGPGIDTDAAPKQTADFKNFQTCQTNPPDINSINPVGCVNTLVGDTDGFIKQNSKIAIGIAAGIIGLEIILIVLAFVVCCMELEGGGKYV